MADDALEPDTVPMEEDKHDEGEKRGREGDQGEGERPAPHNDDRRRDR